MKQKSVFEKFRSGGKNLLGPLLIAVVLSSCDKKDDLPEEQEPPTESANVYYKLQRVENMPTGTEDASAPLDARPTVYYSLGTNQVVDAKYAKSARWDMAFGGMFNCYFSGNNGKNSTNPGFMGTGNGGIMIVEGAFEDIVDIPSDDQFKTGGEVFGSDANGNYGDKVGWFLYDFNGTIVSDGRPEKMHVAYALASPLTLRNGKVIPPRTIILRTAQGDYAKIKMISCYKGLYTPDEWFMNSPFVFFTFEYVVVPAGSTKFEIRN